MKYRCPKCGWEGTQLWIVRQQWALMDGDKEVEQKKTRFHTRESLAHCPECELVTQRGNFFPDLYEFGIIGLTRDDSGVAKFEVNARRANAKKYEEFQFPINREGYKALRDLFARIHVERLSASSSLDFPAEFGVRRRQVASCERAIEQGMEVC